MAPTPTSIGRCPRSSLNSIRSCWFSCWCSSWNTEDLSNWFKKLACVPACRLIPAASNMVMALTTTAIANEEEDTPSEIPIAVVSEETAAECELGIPPVLNPSLRFQVFLVSRCKGTLINWARTIEDNAADSG
jgi:hypothetical protein